MALQPYRDRTAAKIINEISEDATSSDIPLQVTYRYKGTQQWQTSKGHVVYRHGVFQWHDVQGAVEPWPVQHDVQYGNFQRLTGLAEEAITSTAQQAEEGINHTVNNAVAFMAQASSAASGSSSQALQPSPNSSSSSTATSNQKDTLTREFQKSEARLAKERKSSSLVLLLLAAASPVASKKPTLDKPKSNTTNNATKADNNTNTNATTADKNTIKNSAATETNNTNISTKTTANSNSTYAAVTRSTQAMHLNHH